MISDKFIGQGLTYDDVLLVPSFSEILPREVSIISRFSRNISLNVPIVSAAMDTVTESRMAIAMAQEGGIGVLHKNMTIEDQAKKVRTVKRAESGMIIDLLDQVLIGLRLPLSWAFSTFLSNLWSTYGPFLIDRGIAEIIYV